MSEDRNLRDRLDRPAPGETEAGERSLELARAAFEGREPVPRRRFVWRPVLAVGVTVLAVVAALTPAGSAVGSWIADTGERLGVTDPDEPRSLKLPAPGRLLVNTQAGAWILDESGSQQRIGNYRDATWSPGGLYVIATDAPRKRLIAATPGGKVRWSLDSRPPVNDPRWAPSGLRVAYLAGGSLRVVDGDGSDDGELAATVAQVPPSWRPGENANVLSYITRSGMIVTANADSRNELWRSQDRAKFVQLDWSADGQRLAAVTDQTLRIYGRDGSPAARYRLSTDFPIAIPGEVEEVAFAPTGNRLAIARERRGGSQTEVVIVKTTGEPGQPTRVFRGTGAIGDVTWSPDGEWLLVAADGVTEWVFVDITGRSQREVLPDTTHLLGSRTELPDVSGWCCPLP